MQLSSRSPFRPLAGFTLFCLVFFGVLIGLGVWQLERLQWKRALMCRGAPP